MLSISRWIPAVLLVAGSLWAAPVLIYRQTFDTYAEAKATFADTLKYVLRADTFGMAGVLEAADSTKSATVSIPLDPDSLRGGKVVFSAWTSARDLTLRPNPWNGVKVMLVSEDSAGVKSYPQLSWPDSVRSWGWTRSWKVAPIPQNLKKASLVVGFELMAGKVRFDSLRVERITQSIAPARDPNLPIPDFSPTRFRGAMIGTHTADSAAIREFGETWKGNLLRWQLNAPYGHDSGLWGKDFERQLAQQLDILDTALPLCQKAGIQVVVDLHTLAKGLFHDRACQTRLIETWKRIVTRFGRHPAVWGWDLANEPTEDEWSDGLLFWDDLADTLAREIRKLDTSKVIIVEPGGGGSVRQLPNLKPVGWSRGWDIPKVVYSFHFYDPANLTHQGVTGHPPIGVRYPDTISGVFWDSAQMRKALNPAYEFQRKYRVPLYVGEFSCIRWAPDHSALRWLTDFTRLAEEAGWDWTYHAYREWDGWSVEHSDSALDLRTYPTTDRKSLLLGHFAKNQDPYRSASVGRPTAPSPLQPRWRRDDATTLFVDNLAPDAHPDLVRLDGTQSREPEVSSKGWMFSRVDNGLWILRVRQGKSVRSWKLILL